MKLVELIAMFETFSNHCVFNNKDININTMDEVKSIELDLNSDDHNYYLNVYCKSHTYNHKVPKISDDILKKLRKNVHKICENSSDEIVNKDLHINIKIEDDEY